MALRVRRLTEADTDAMERSFVESFGEFDHPDPPVPMHAEGKTWWGIEIDGAVVATALDREYHSWFGGALVPTAGIGGVTVAAEFRGQGLLTPLFDALLSHARDRGAVISTLFATAPGIYRRFGFETVTSLDRVRVRASALAVGGSTEVRRATEADSAAIYDVHNREAARCNGRIARVGPLFAEPPTLRVSGVTVAERDHQIVGYVSWSRGRGYGATGELVVNQLIGDDADSLRSLLSFVARFDSVTPHIVFSTSGIAPWQHLLATAHPEPVSSAPYALAVLDPIALTQTTLSDSLNCRLPFRIHQPGGKVDDRVLVVEAGQSSLEAGDDSGRSFTPGGLALTFAGAHTSASLRAIGYVSGDDADDSTWDALMCRGPVTVDTYF